MSLPVSGGSFVLVLAFLGFDIDGRFGNSRERLVCVLFLLQHSFQEFDRLLVPMLRGCAGVFLQSRIAAVGVMRRALPSLLYCRAHHERSMAWPAWRPTETIRRPVNFQNGRFNKGLLAAGAQLMATMRWTELAFG